VAQAATWYFPLPPDHHKGFYIAREIDTCLYFVQSSASGEIPQSLKGKYTRIDLCKQQIDNFLKKQKQQQKVHQ
jgi:hypothetical protein